MKSRQEVRCLRFWGINGCRITEGILTICISIIIWKLVFAYYGEGTVTFKEDIPFDGNMFTVIPKNFPHTTTSAGDSVSYWEWLFIDADKFLREVYKDNPRMAQKVLDRVNRRAHFVRVQDKPQIGALVQQIIGCMRERKEFYLEEVKGLTPGSSFTGGKVESGGSGKDRIRGGKYQSDHTGP